MTVDLLTLLGPVSLEEFFNRYWESRPLVLQLDRAALCQSLLQVPDVEFLTASLGSLDAKWIRLVNNRPGGPMREFQRPGQGVSMDRILDAYREGTTVVLNDLQRRWPPIRDLASRLWHDFNDAAELPLRAVGVNAYLSPPNAEGLAAHFDSHCVFILQISGRKTWTLYDEREELPSPDGLDPSASRATRADAPGTRVHEVTLASGDFVYIPRGLVHKAQTADSHSLHLAVGLYPCTWGEVLADAIRSVPACRRSLPRGSLSGTHLSPETQRAFASVMQSVVDRTSAATAIGLARTEIERLRERLQSRGFERCHAVEAIDRHTRVVRRGDVRLSLTRQGEKVVMEIGSGNSFQAPAAAEPALRYIIENRSFTLSFMPGMLSEGSKRVLVKRLLKEGVLELAPTEETCQTVARTM
ncbi:MAG: hypothetical protein DMF88_14330 [Acidobacteria bacterium]|nr:MAG: hypothetical protein DMF88_14330 [Acidobacteriota bacterium]